MADITEFQLMKIYNFSDGTDFYRGIVGVQSRINPLNTLGVIPENALRPTRHEFVETRTPKASGQLIMNGPNSDALIGTTIASATATCRDVLTESGTKTITWTNLKILGRSGSVNNTSVAGVQYDYVADNEVIS
ncbi:MAG: hypothetical protein AAGI37_06920 [Planctomycetota bacterium]